MHRALVGAGVGLLLVACGGDPNESLGETEDVVADGGAVVDGDPTTGAEPDSGVPSFVGRCYVDHDLDGVGAGDAVGCESAEVARVTGDCDDEDPARAPGQPEVCDGVDNDCDGAVDEDAKNACEGVCGAPFESPVGAMCSNGQVGACARDGIYECQSGGKVECDAPSVDAGVETCGNGIDEDCDGETDEADAADARIWYLDCDADGYAASTRGAKTSCQEPPQLDGCGWTDVFPGEYEWDCDDSSAGYRPGIEKGIRYGDPLPDKKLSRDLNCNGKITPEWRFADYIPCSLELIRWTHNPTSWNCEAAPLQAACYMWIHPQGGFNSVPREFCPDKPYLASRTVVSGIARCTVAAAASAAIVPCL